MGASRDRRLRAVGRRIEYSEVPAAVREYMRSRFGAHEVLGEHPGGMSPGCATTLATADGDRVFVKAVGQELNERTTELFRREAQVLRRLPDVSYRARLLDTFDDGGWVALCLEHIEGEHPDLTDESDFEAVAGTIRRQTVELTPPPADVDAESLAETALRWASQWEDITREPSTYLPAWAADDAEALAARVQRLPAALEPESLCHFDVRDDNLLLTGGSNPVVLDWGNPRIGPAWTDLVFLAAQHRDAEAAVGWLDTQLPAAVRDTVATFFVAFGGSQAWNARHRYDPSLPAMPDFCREDSTRLLAIARLLLAPYGQPPGGARPDMPRSARPQGFDEQT